MHWYLWLDLETTGLNPYQDRILEVGWELAYGTSIPHRPSRRVIHIPNLCPSHFSDGEQGIAWKMHTDNGLISDCQAEGCGHELLFVENDIIQEMDALTSVGTKIHLAGSSIHFDRRFIRANMPRLDGWLHYRMMDVTSVWMAVHEAGLHVNGMDVAHRAPDDVVESEKMWLRCLDAMETRLDKIPHSC